MTLFIPGPYKCELSDRVAAGVSDLVAAICALALGTPVKRFPMLSFLRGDDRKLAEESRRDPQILGLARDSVSLDIIGEFQGIGGLDGFMKVRNSLITYHAALEQSNADVVVMLMVTAIEALVTPNQSWAKDGRTTQRFISAVISVVPGAVDELLEHANCEEAFGYRQRGGTNRRRIDLLSRIYELRSNPSHRGLSASGASFMSAMADSGSMRAALLSDLARAMILAFVQAPRSFLTGHPVIDPPKVAA